MGEAEFDGLLRRALMQAATEDHAEALARSDDPSFSPRYLRERMRLLADPWGWQRKRARPVWRRALRAAACILLVCVLSLAAVLTASPTARARFVNWVTEWSEQYIAYRFRGEPAAREEMPAYTIGALPEGYKETERLVTPAMVNVTYENPEGLRIYLDYMYMEQGGMFYTYMEDMEVKEITFQGCPGQFYESLDPQQSNSIVWMDEETNLSFTIDAFATEQELLHIAESIYLVK